MSRPSYGRLLLCVATALMMLATNPSAWGQATQGRVDVTVLDPNGRTVPDAKLELKDLATNSLRTGATQGGGTYSFVNLPLGKYKLTVTKDGFQTATYDVTVESTKVTDVEASLKVGAVTEVVEVGAVAPVVDTTTNAIGQVINLKGIENLPIAGRDITQLSRYSAGYNGTWNGLPSIAQGANIDGVMAGPSRMKFGGLQEAVVPRLENIEEMTVQTDSLDVNQGFGQSSMQLNYTTRRGSNDFHGRLFEDFRNSALNANSWRNNASGIARPFLIRNEFGGSIGGPILKDKLFFFGSISTFRQPGTSVASASVLTAGGQAGNYTYVGTDNLTHTVNVFTVAQNWNTANGTTLPTSVNSIIGAQLTKINGSLQSGTVSPTTDPIVNTLNWLSPNPAIQWYPTVRVDYAASSRIRINVAWNMTKTSNPSANLPFFPGSGFASTGDGNRFKAYTASLGIDWTISPRLVNQFRGGFLYNASFFDYNASSAYQTDPQRVGWPIVSSPQQHNVPVGSYYPVFNASDTLSWQKAAHTFNLGFSYYREQDHYYNPPELANVSLGLVQGDPALDALTPAGSYNPLPLSNPNQQGEAQNLYALLTGRISGIGGSFPLNPKTGQYIPKPAMAYNLDELSKAWALFFQDSWRIRPSFTFNYGLRWDFTGDNHDLTSAYHNADVSSLLGPSSALFQPGVLGGNLNPMLVARQHTYNSWNKSPQPEIGLAWSPHFENSFLQKMAGRDDTVIRASFSLRKFTVPYQYFWNTASDYGSFFYQFYSLTAQNIPGVGNYQPGSLTLGQALPPFLLLPPSYQKTAPESLFTFNNSQFSNGSNGFKFNIGQPYTQTWSLGIQRKLGQSRALEIRYNGNRTVKQWIAENLNEVNVFENGFLQDFKDAQINYNICVTMAAACVAAAGDPVGSGRRYFSNLGLPGQIAVPILTAAFTGSTTGAQNNSNFRNGTFITRLTTGAVGAFASTLSGVGSSPFLCNLVGAGFSPCATNAGYAGAGAGFPINFFQANPYAAGIPSLEMTDTGFSTYNSLQVDFRQRQWHGIEFDANYTWSHTLGVATPNDWTGAYPAFTLRNLQASYAPTLFDLRHVAHVLGTVDLPFGRGRKFANKGGWSDRFVGGWTIGTIVTYQTGYPFRVLGGFSTFNNIADGGVVLNGVTKSSLQSVIGVYRIPGKNFVSLLPANYLLTPTGGGANPNIIVGNTTPGIFTPPLWLYGPHGFYDDMSLSKSIPITERWRFSIQAEFLNVFNHPVFGQGTTPIGGNVRGTSWATTGSTNGPRNIELRANISF